MSRLLKGLNLSRSVDSILLPEHVPSDGSCDINNYTPLGSYNWADSPIPTLIIPGQPRVWKAPSLPMPLSQDSGYTFVNQNVWRCPESPLEPIFHAIQVTQKSLGNESFVLSEQSIDVVTDRGNLRKILQFVKTIRTGASLTPSKNREFRIDAQLAPNNRTVLLTRFDSRPGRLEIDPTQPSSYGNAFESAVTSPYPPVRAVTRSENIELLPCSYHRIARYNMADLRLLVRYEVDAMLGASSPDDLAAELQEMTIRQDHVAQVKKPARSTLHHIVAGRLAPQESIIELKSASKSIKWNDALPQLYLSQTPRLTAGYHNRGTLTRIESHSVGQSAPLVAARQKLSSDLPYLVEILKRMREICQQHIPASQQSSHAAHIAFFWSGTGGIQAYRINKPTKRHYLDKQLVGCL
ncbi:hypothetical protein BDV93DRAFT_13223 [Ceratobasidium sp. AG-I]|nr:hypothetical protein BDV93DRAFT_13223 [Ceratobasidium sp. AG-I]